MSFSMGEEEVRGVWRGWIRLAAGAAPSPTAIRREREAWVVQHVANKPGSRMSTADAAAETLTSTTLARFKPFMTSDGVDSFMVKNWSPHGLHLHAPNLRANLKHCTLRGFGVICQLCLGLAVVDVLSTHLGNS